MVLLKQYFSPQFTLRKVSPFLWAVIQGCIRVTTALTRRENNTQRVNAVKT